MLNKLDYSYNGENSILNQVHPVVKFWGYFVYIVLCLVKFDQILFICNLSFVFLLLLLSNVRFTKYLKVVWKLKYILCLLYAFMYHKQMAFIDMNIVVFQFLFFILYGWMIVYSTTMDDIGRGSSIILNLFNFFGISIKSISLFITNLFVFKDYFIDSYNDFFKKLEVEGIVYSDSTIFTKMFLFIKNFKRIWLISICKMKLRKQDLKYRMFDKKSKSKYKYRNKLCFFDYIYVFITLGMLIYYIVKVR